MEAFDLGKLVRFGGLAPPLGAREAPVRRVLGASFSRSDDDLDAGMSQVARGEALIWVIEDDGMIAAAAMTELRHDGRQCFIRHCAGSDVRRWLPFIAGIEAWARWAGCDSIALSGRRGWSRMLGWEWRGGECSKAL